MQMTLKILPKGHWAYVIVINSGQVCVCAIAGYGTLALYILVQFYNEHVELCTAHFT
jgi:hypothetical protein